MENRANRNLGVSDILIMFVTFLALSSFLLIYATGIFWIAHAVTGTVSLVFAALTTTAGAVVRGRAKRIQGLNLKIHRRLGIALVFLIGITFFYGPYARWLHDEFLFWQHTEPLGPVFKGWLGLAVLVIAVLQAALSLSVKDRNRIRKLHTIIGYSLVALLIVETVAGSAIGISELSQTTELILRIF